MAQRALEKARRPVENAPAREPGQRGRAWYFAASTMLIFFLGALTAFAGHAGMCDDVEHIEARIRHERLTGSRQQAEALAREALACQGMKGEIRVGLRLELARIHDRHGLHTNTRPVAEALAQIRSAQSEGAGLGPAVRARIQLALARYQYRAEMAERAFVEASRLAAAAKSLFATAGDADGLVDAVHLQGLIALQKRDLTLARELFDRSLELSRQSAVRPLFLSDYHRHIAFVDRFAKDFEAALSHFRASHALRVDSAARDHAMFSATALASALIDAGRANEAEPLLVEALAAARELRSPVGEVRAILLSARMHESLGRLDRALERYERALPLARELRSSASERAAREGIERLRRPGL